MYTDNVSETEEWIRIVEAERGTISKSSESVEGGRASFLWLRPICTISDTVIFCFFLPPECNITIDKSYIINDMTLSPSVY